MIALLLAASANDARPAILIPSKVCNPVGRPSGPVSVGLLPGRLGNTVDPCVRTEAGIAVGGGLLVDTPDFYGRIQAFGALDVRVGLSERVELHGRFEGFRLDNVIAPVAVSASGIGATSIGMTVVLEQSLDHVISAHGQVVLPTQPHVNAAPLALDAGMTAARAVKNGDLHGGVAVYGQGMLGRGPSAGKAALSGRIGTTQRITKTGLAFVLDAPLSVGWTGGFDHLGLAGAFRFGTGRVGDPTPDGESPDGRGLYGELGVMAPLFGRERTLAALELKIGARFR